MLLGAYVGTADLLLHVINLDMQDAQAVNSPSGTLGIDPCIGLSRYVVKLFPEIAVNTLHQVRTVLIAFVNTAFERQGINGIDFRVADDVLQVPLYYIYPVLAVEVVLDGAFRIRIGARGVHMVGLVVILHGLVENGITPFGKIHICSFCHNFDGLFTHAYI